LTARNRNRPLNRKSQVGENRNSTKSLSEGVRHDVMPELNGKVWDRMPEVE
jgi:hypothetical protein